MGTETETVGRTSSIVAMGSETETETVGRTSSIVAMGSERLRLRRSVGHPVLLQWEVRLRLRRSVGHPVLLQQYWMSDRPSQSQSLTFHCNNTGCPTDRLSLSLSLPIATILDDRPTVSVSVSQCLSLSVSPC